MPTRALRPCAHPGCSELVVAGRCKAHRAQLFREQDAARGTPTDRGYGAEWKRIRYRVLLRDELICQTPGCYAQAQEVDHIVPKAMGGTDEMDNLRSLCSRCHRERHANDRRLSARMG